MRRETIRQFEAATPVWVGRQPKRARRSVDVVPFCIEIPGCGCLDDCDATVDLDYGEIVNVQIGGLNATPYQVEAMMGPSAYMREVHRIKNMVPDLISKAIRDAHDADADDAHGDS
ncbi:hypothetical protein [Paenirhodobacter populi]|uniref:hypothetical protein n=1 Tax=Paenirhodobacter populi TaxID=2306993 RepID=UPI0013E2BED7|nr:hypothetical protein [Sinirhodobacter populi]